MEEGADTDKPNNVLGCHCLNGRDGSEWMARRRHQMSICVAMKAQQRIPQQQEKNPSSWTVVWESGHGSLEHVPLMAWRYMRLYTHGTGRQVHKRESESERIHLQCEAVNLHRHLLVADW